MNNSNNSDYHEMKSNNKLKNILKSENILKQKKEAEKTSNSDLSDCCEVQTNIIQERKYIYLPLIRNIKGYVVSQQDADNFLIDLSFNEKLKERYASVGIKKYIYVDSDGGLKIGEAYKCHLFGVTILDKGQAKGQRAYNLISRKINDSDGIVICDLGDIDIYGRILVSLYDDLNLVNLNQLLLNTNDKITNKPFGIKYGRL
jgi:hypothetical protein